MAVSYNVWIRVWDPIMGKFGKDETLANTVPLTRDEADQMALDLGEAEPAYGGQGMALHGVRVEALARSACL